VHEVLSKVEQHLALCPECREEYLALVKILQAGP
jgi:predicted anti-sigma-YlaC factor YlaD